MKEIKNLKLKDSKATHLFLVLVAFLLVFILFSSIHVSADAPKAKLTDDQRGEISMSCSSIKSGLKKLQVSDAKIRSLLGANYQTILNSYITPFNLRLVKNNQNLGDLSDLQSNFVLQKNDFNSLYIAYSQQFENLLSIDCQKNPDDFYNQLIITRESRKELNQKVEDLTKTAEKYLVEIKKIEIEGENIRFTPEKADSTKASSITNPANQVEGR
mgnify:CR=1 FL=1